MKKAKNTVRRHRTPYTPYEYTPTEVVGPGARQSMKDDVDVNNIVARYQTTGVLTHLNSSQATYADVSELGGYRDALDKVMAAESLFMSLPSELRAQYDNDPAKYLDAIGKMTAEQLEELGSKEYGNYSGITPDEAPAAAVETADSGESG